MRWLLRFLLWLAVLAFPCQLAAGAYQRLLIGGVAWVVGLHVPEGRGAGVDLSASNMLGVFAAMCLASTSAPRAARARALGLGLFAMVLIELATGLASIVAERHQTAHGAWRPSIRKAFDALLSVPRFTSGPVAWLVFLGPFELPARWMARLSPRWRRNG